MNNITRTFKIPKQEVAALATKIVATIKVPFGQTFKIQAAIRMSVDDGASVYEHGYAEWGSVVRNGLGDIRTGQVLTVTKPGSGYTASPGQATTAVAPSRGSALTLATTVDGDGKVLTATRGSSGGSLYAPNDVITLDGGTAQVTLAASDIQSMQTFPLVASGGGNDDWNAHSRSMVGTDPFVFSYATNDETKEVEIKFTSATVGTPSVVEGHYTVTYMANTPV